MTLHSTPATPLVRPTPGADDVPVGLPPLDGDDKEREDEPEKLGDDELPTDDGGDPFDDSTGEGDAVPELDDDAVVEREGLLDAAPADDLDVGAGETLGSETDRLTDDGREEEALGDYDLPDDDGLSDRDQGDEGPTTEDESLTDEGLPPLDQDDDGAEGDASAFFDEAFETRQGGTWPAPWERFGPPLSAPAARALARHRGGVLSAGRELARVDLEGGVDRVAARGLPGGEVNRVFLRERDGDEAIFVTTEAGGLFVSRDHGATFSELSAWRERVTPEEAARGLDMVVTDDDGIWGRTAQGALLQSRDYGATWEGVPDIDGFVEALGTDDQGGVILLVRALAEREVLRRTKGGLRRVGLPKGLFPSALAKPVVLVASGDALVLAVEGEAVARYVDGRSWTRVAGAERATAVALLDDSGTLVVALGGGETGAKSSLVRVSPLGETVTVASWEERTDADDRVTALAVDASHQVVWVAGGFGVAAFQPKMRPT